VKSTRWVMTYIVVASLGLWGALFMSLKFMTPGHAQAPGANPSSPQEIGPPSAGDLPPEFVQEAQGGKPAPTGGGAIPPPPTQPPAQAPAPAEVLPPPPPAVPPTAPVGEFPQPTEEASTPVIPQFASDDQYTYDPSGRRDPFKPYRSIRPPPSLSQGLGQTRVVDESDPLQRWDLERFAVVAILWEVRQPKALVQDPDGKTYMIGKRTRIGRNNGQVVAIREGEVVVVEEIDNEGVQTKEVKILELKK